jgi:hypothetical protein
MAGVTLPASVCSFRTTRSSLVSFEVSGRSVWLTNSESRGCPEDLAIETPEPASAPVASDDDERSPGSEGAPEVRQRAAPGGVEDDVVALRTVVPGVVEDVVCADRADKILLVVLQRPVTSAPNALASCSANDPTPPSGPMN